MTDYTAKDVVKAAMAGQPSKVADAFGNMVYNNLGNRIADERAEVQQTFAQMAASAIDAASDDAIASLEVDFEGVEYDSVEAVDELETEGTDEDV